MVRSIAVLGVYFGRMSSPLRRNAQIYCERYNISLRHFFQLSSKLIKNKVMASVLDGRISTSGLVRELCFFRDSSLCLSTSFFTIDEVNHLISCLRRM